jgi:hypothetical protein
MNRLVKRVPFTYTLISVDLMNEDKPDIQSRKTLKRYLYNPGMTQSILGKMYHPHQLERVVASLIL